MNPEFFDPSNLAGWFDTAGGEPTASDIQRWEDDGGAVPAEPKKRVGRLTDRRDAAAIKHDIDRADRDSLRELVPVS